MRQFCLKFGLPQYLMSKKIQEYDTIMVNGYSKPRIIVNEKNIELAKFHSRIPPHRPRNPLLTIDEFIAKYKISESQLRRRWKCIQKFEFNGQIYISEIRNNLRHAGII